MTAGADEKQQVLALAVKHRADHRDIGQMCAPVIRVVDHIGIAGQHPTRIGMQHSLD